MFGKIDWRSTAMCSLKVTCKVNLYICAVLLKSKSLNKIARYFGNNTHEKITRFWLAKSVQFKCNTSAKSVTSVQKV